MQPVIFDELKKALATEHDRLVGELKGIARPDGAAASGWRVEFPRMEPMQDGSHATSDEEADEVEEYEVLLGAENSLETRLLQVNRALECMALGTYGVCAVCKKPIPLERLRANPAAACDIACSAPDIVRGSTA